VASENEFCKNPTSKDTITTIDSESYDSIGGHKHSLDQHTTSNSFLISTHQVNALIMGPAGYRVADFMRAGGIMSVLFLTAMMLMMNLVF